MTEKIKDSKKAFAMELKLLIKQKCYDLPNFNADKFVECLGIEHI